MGLTESEVHPLADFVYQFLLIGSSICIIAGGIVPYVFQYWEIRQRQNAHGFSIHVCLTLLIANILRILFWFGKHFEVQLLIQSIIMIVCMFMMVELTVAVNRKHLLPPHRPITVWDGHLLDFFWAWTDFASYVVVIAGFTSAAALATTLWIHSNTFVETLGFLALFVEANLGIGQFYKNWERRSTVGMSLRMVLMWMVGDVAKTAYFLVRSTPAQFWLCGFYQIAVDVLILGQVRFYKGQRSAEVL